MNSYDAIGSVISCDKWHKHQCFYSSAMAACSTWGSLWTGATLSVSWNRNFPNKEVRLLHSPVRSRLKRSNFLVKLKDCFANARRHGTWNSLGRTNTRAIFPQSVVQLLGGIWLAYHYYGATTGSKQFRNMNEESVRMARSESPGTRLLHSLVSRRLALWIYSVQRLWDRERSTLCR